MNDLFTGRPEILAPGGSISSIYAALNAGCDAIYTSGQKYGARAFADNPDDEALVSVINDVHFYNKKIYITINTILNENDFRELYSFLDLLYKAGADAVIVQDLGVLDFVHKEFPGLDIHASTQMNITQGSAANFLKDYGVTRIVPARELSFKELNMMRKTTDLELEVFVQGALCYSHSGQCLMSSLIGGRSGNKGACAQPCRKLYSVNDKEEYLLSLKDLCTLDHIPELIDAGIDSFKIEGRMKKPEYAAFTTHLYRKYVDLFYELGRERYEEKLASTGMLNEDMRKLKDIYNRGGFTCGYLVDSYDKSVMLSGNRPNHEGIKVGRIDRIDYVKKLVRMAFTEDINAGDILEIRYPSGVVAHEHTMKDAMEKDTRIWIKTGYKFDSISDKCSIYRIRNNALINNIKTSFPDSLIRKGVSGEFVAMTGSEAMLSLYITETPEICAYVTGEVVTAAEKRAASKEDIESKIKVNNDDRFVFDELNIVMDDNIFLSPKMLKDMRRSGLKELYNSAVEYYKFNNLKDRSRLVNDDKAEVEKTLDPGREIVAEVYNKAQFDMCNKDDLFNVIYIHVEDLSFNDLNAMVSEVAENKAVYAYMPRIFRIKGEQYFDGEFDIDILASKSAFKGFVICNLEELVYLSERIKGTDLTLRNAENLYVRNKYAYRMLTNAGMDRISPSVECFVGELEKLVDMLPLDVCVYKDLQAMVTAIDMSKTPVFKDSFGNTYRAAYHERYGYSDVLHYETFDLTGEDLVRKCAGVRIAVNTVDNNEYKKITGKIRKRLG